MGTKSNEPIVDTLANRGLLNRSVRPIVEDTAFQIHSGTYRRGRENADIEKVFWGETDKDGNVKIDAENEDSMKTFNAEIIPILNSDVKITTKLKLDDVMSENIPSDILVNLYDIIEE